MHGAKITGMETLQELYDSEINFSITTLWDAGFRWKLGDDMNGFVAEGEAETLKLAGAVLKAAALKHFPGSAFAAHQYGHKN